MTYETSVTRDPNTEDLNVLNMLESIDKHIYETELSHPEINKLKDDFFIELRNDLDRLNKTALRQKIEFVRLGLIHHYLRKTLFTDDPASYSDLASNNSNLKEIYLQIGNTISEHELIRQRLNS